MIRVNQSRCSDGRARATLVKVTLAALAMNAVAVAAPPLTVRLNDTNRLEKEVLPPLWEASGLGLSYTPAGPDNTDFVGLDIVGFEFGVYITTQRDHVIVDFPMDSKTLNIEYLSTNGDRAKVRCTIKAPEAYASSGLVVQVQPTIVPPDWVADAYQLICGCNTSLLDTISLNNYFGISADGLNATVTATLVASDGQFVLESIDSLTASVGSVSVSDTGPLVELLNLTALAWSNLFENSPGSSANACAKNMVNAAIKLMPLKDDIASAINAELAKHASVTAMSNQYKIHNTVTLKGQATPQSVKTIAGAIGELRSTWSYKLTADGGKNLPFSYTELVRPPQSLKDWPQIGDVQAFVPLDLCDRVAYELYRAGLLGNAMQVELPGKPFNHTGSLNAKFSVSPTGCLRAIAGPENQTLVLEGPVALIGSGDLGLTIKGKGTLRVELKITIDSGRRIMLQFHHAALVGVSGTAQFFGKSVNLGELAKGLAEATVSELTKTLKPFPVSSSLTKLQHPVYLSLNDVMIGSEYIVASFKYLVK